MQAARAFKVPAATAVQSAYRGKVGRRGGGAADPVLFVEGDLRPAASSLRRRGGSGDDDGMDVAALAGCATADAVARRDGSGARPQRLLDGKLLTADDMDIPRHGRRAARRRRDHDHRLREGKMLTAAEMEVLRAAQQQGADVEELQQRLLEGKLFGGGEEVLDAARAPRHGVPQT